MSESEALQKAIAATSIEDVYLHDSHATIHSDFDPRIAGESFAVQMRANARRGQLLSKLDADGKKSERLRVFVDTGVRFVDPVVEKEEIKDEKEISKYVKAEIRATFVAEYSLKFELDQKEIDEFSKKNAVFHVWPYWREFIQNTCARLRLPLVVIPMYRMMKEGERKSSAESHST